MESVKLYIIVLSPLILPVLFLLALVSEIPSILLIYNDIELHCDFRRQCDMLLIKILSVLFIYIGKYWSIYEVLYGDYNTYVEQHIKDAPPLLQKIVIAMVSVGVLCAINTLILCSNVVGSIIIYVASIEGKFFSFATLIPGAIGIALFVFMMVFIGVIIVGCHKAMEYHHTATTGSLKEE